MKTQRTVDPIDDTKLLLDRIISWEKDLSEYESLEPILRSQFLILKRKAKNGLYEIEHLQRRNAELLELIDAAFVAGRSRTTWGQFKEDHNL